jgi:hypothetical protein
MLWHVNYRCVRTDGFTSKPLALTHISTSAHRVSSFQTFPNPIEFLLFSHPSLPRQLHNPIQIP